MYRRTHGREVLIVLGVLLQFYCGTAQAQFPEWLNRWRSHRKPAKNTVELLAHDLDDLEDHLDAFGTIVTKQPDVWGEARMTKYREEYEEILEKQKGEFTFRLNGAIRRADNAFLASALALDQASQSGNRSFFGRSPTTTTAAGDVTNTPTDVNIFSFTNGLTGNPLASSTPTTGVGLLSRSDNPTATTPNVGIEPTIHLDQLSRYMNHLHHLRRINEGGDVADAPGYALHLVRIPVSIIPGKRTRQGYGAEITVTAEPQLGEDLLPVTFRGLVIKDVIDQLGLGVTKIVNDPRIKSLEIQIVFSDCLEAVGFRDKIYDHQMEKDEHKRDEMLEDFLDELEDCLYASRRLSKDQVDELVAKVGDAANQLPKHWNDTRLPRELQTDGKMRIGDLEPGTLEDHQMDLKMKRSQKSLSSKAYADIER
ncbi:MAG: hypothetical protein N2C14_30230, partial [Planctomycetales bacterium]